LTGSSRNYQVDDLATPTLTNIGGESKGILTFTSGQLSSATIEVSAPSVSLAFSETFISPSTQSLPGLPAPIRVYTADKTDPVDGTVRSLLLLDPVSAGLSYSTLGAWGYEDPSNPTQSFGGWLAIGIETRGADIPTTGTADYFGGMAGIYADGTTLYQVGATASAKADFGARNIQFSTTNTFKRDLNTPGAIAAATPSLDITGNNLQYPAGQNRISGAVTSSTMSGTTEARFFGPAASELGGTFFMQNGAKTEQMSGGFVLKKQ